MVMVMVNLDKNKQNIIDKITVQEESNEFKMNQTQNHETGKLVHFSVPTKQPNVLNNNCV